MPTVEEFLEHHGVKGMKWGIRNNGKNRTFRLMTSGAPRPSSRPSSRGRSGPVDVVLKNKGHTRIKTVGGSGHPPSEDAVRTAKTRQKAKKSSVHALSNKELQDAIQRMNLERQYKGVATSNPAKKFLSKLLQDAGQRKASQVVGKVIKAA